MKTDVSKGNALGPANTSSNTNRPIQIEHPMFIYDVCVAWKLKGRLNKYKETPLNIRSVVYCS